MAAVLVLLAILALDLLRIGSHVGLRLYRAAPYILPNLMLKFRWTRLHRNFQASLHSSAVLRKYRKASNHFTGEAVSYTQIHDAYIMQMLEA